MQPAQQALLAGLRIELPRPGAAWYGCGEEGFGHWLIQCPLFLMSVPVSRHASLPCSASSLLSGHDATCQRLQSKSSRKHSHVSLYVHGSALVYLQACHTCVLAGLLRIAPDKSGVAACCACGNVQSCCSRSAARVHSADGAGGEQREEICVLCTARSNV